MKQEKQAQFFERIAATLQELGLEHYLLEGAGGIQTGDTLRTLVPVTERGEAVIMELSLARFNEELDFLQFYTTLIMRIGEGRDELLRATFPINFYCPVGAFGVFEKEGQYYHKYGLVLDPEADMDLLEADAMTAFQALYDVLSEYFPVVSRMSEGELTYEQAVRERLLQG